jgi:hypothetical protein
LVDSYHQRHPRAPAPSWLRRRAQPLGTRLPRRPSGTSLRVRLPGLGLRPPPLAGATVMTSRDSIGPEVAPPGGAVAQP